MSNKPTGRTSHKTEDEWQAELSEEQFRICRQKGTERAFTGRYWDHHEAGTYHCACCAAPLFASIDKYESGSGWPSYVQPVSGEAVSCRDDYLLAYPRIEVVCTRCEAHLGHVFDDGPPPTGKRYCINSASLDFRPEPDSD